MQQPTPITMTDAMKEAYAYAKPEHSLYDTLCFKYKKGTSMKKIRVVNSDVSDHFSGDPMHYPCRFSFRLPTTESQVVGALEIDLPFLPKEAVQWITKASMDGGRFTVQWQQIRVDEPGRNTHFSADAKISPLEIISVDRTPTGAMVTATIVDLINIPFPRLVMTAQDFPGAVV